MNQNETHDGNELTHDDLMKEFARVINLRNKRPNEMTKDMLAEMAQITPRRAEYILKKLVRAGILVVRRGILHENHTYNGYSPADGYTWQDAISALGESDAKSLTTIST